MSGYVNEFTRENNPLACGLAKYGELDGSVDFLGRETLRRIAREGHQREMRGVLFDGGAWPPCGEPWPAVAGKADGPQIGQITSAPWPVGVLRRCARTLPGIGRPVIGLRLRLHGCVHRHRCTRLRCPVAPGQARCRACRFRVIHAPISVVVLLALAAHRKHEDQIGHLVIFIQGETTGFAS